MDQDKERGKGVLCVLVCIHATAFVQQEDTGKLNTCVCAQGASMRGG